MPASVKSFRLSGIDAIPVTVECEVTKGLGIHLIGLADAATKETLLRVVTALQSQGYRIPGKKIIINVAPANLYKNSSALDLPIALALLAASEQISLKDADKYVVVGELGLDGTVRVISGAVCCACMDIEGLSGIVLPGRDALQAAEATEGKVPVYGVDSLEEAVKILSGEVPGHTAWDEFRRMPGRKSARLSFDAIANNPQAVRAAEIAAAGGHGLLLVGAPGTGKGSIAKAVSELLPGMTGEEALESDRIFSASAREIHHGVRPFRAPHYSASIAALLGGGATDHIQPGEVTLAHGGVLFLDDWPEFPKSAKEALRAPLEDGKVVISRLKSKMEFPAQFIPVLASKPCPCGYHGLGDRCTCSPAQRLAYLSRISGPVCDRTDVQAYITESRSTTPVASFIETAERVRKAREMQKARYGEGRLNASAPAKEIEKSLSEDNRNLLETLITRLSLSARAYSRILRIARTIADLDGRDVIDNAHLAEAAAFRIMDRRGTEDQ